VKRAVATIVVATGVLLGVSACGSDGPHRPCLQGHTEWTIMPITTVGYKGQVNVSMVPEQIFHCDKYGPLPATSGN
jgi:hypothetical protein